MIETSLLRSTFPADVPSRQGRLEIALTRAVAAGSTRSTIREAVEQLADHLRAQDIPIAQAVEVVARVATRAPIDGNAFVSTLDTRVLVTRWVTHRYSRAD